MTPLHRNKNGKVALITGAAQGIGRAFAERLAAEGAIVIGVDRQDIQGFETALKDLGAGDALYARADVTDEAAVEALATQVLERFGRCDILINNVGFTPREPLEQITLAQWRLVMAVNVESFFLTCRAFVPAMKRHAYGRIVNISSDTVGLVIDGFAHYIASKGAVIGLTRALASELGECGITVNSIAPGLTKTPNTFSMFPDGKMFDLSAQAQAIKRPSTPGDLVGAMSFLTSDDAAFMTGQTLIMNGGQLRAL